ncbi:unnamed protein product [Nippostrongylus brasiliensis]|uniref:DUF47 family protein n=1 Tax=Nippostrongylus brasiliensis TaxID=27835 RepID=A0A0N4XIJ3_NIPBR|nr:unnamed protein product [Nippostrongylus brasiliensis]
MKSMYDKARDYLGSAVLCLIEAIAKVEDVLNKAKITKLREDFFNNASADPDHIRELGKNVLKVMNAY